MVGGCGLGSLAGSTPLRRGRTDGLCLAARSHRRAVAAHGGVEGQSGEAIPCDIYVIPMEQLFRHP